MALRLGCTLQLVVVSVSLACPAIISSLLTFPTFGLFSFLNYLFAHCVSL